MSIRRILVCLLSVPLSAANAWDEVRYHRTGSDQLSKSVGEIVEYKNGQLTLRTAAGRERRISADLIDSVETAWLPEHESGVQALRLADFQKALEQLRSAYAKERREWVKRRIMAETIWCYRGLDQNGAACEVFARLIAEDPRTPYYESIPLVWRPFRPPGNLVNRSLEWMNESGNADLMLLGASQLLSGNHAPSARGVLRDLQTRANSRVAILASVQLWRFALVTADEATIDRWRSVIPRIPESLRGGPHYLLGSALHRRRQYERAALELLRVPILYPQYHQLAADALLTAGRSLENANQRENSIIVYRELVQRYSESSAARVGRLRLEQMAKENAQ